MSTPRLLTRTAHAPAGTASATRAKAPAARSGEAPSAAAATLSGKTRTRLPAPTHSRRALPPGSARPVRSSGVHELPLVVLGAAAIGPYRRFLALADDPENAARPTLSTGPHGSRQRRHARRRLVRRVRPAATSATSAALPRGRRVVRADKQGLKLTIL